MLREPLSNDEAKRRASQILRSGEARFSGHALKEMANDSISEDAALGVIRSGYVEFPEQISDSWRYRFRAQDLAVVVAFRSETVLVIVTAWRIKR